ncbi:hypothetical protein ATO1_16050 [Phaeobacter sp. 22II1-1F12B]|nr:hypothetical protein ATO1_16050 [Phaeobacter sp. 22II1-1F12B]
MRFGILNSAVDGAAIGNGQAVCFAGFDDARYITACLDVQFCIARRSDSALKELLGSGFITNR